MASLRSSSVSPAADGRRLGIRYQEARIPRTAATTRTTSFAVSTTASALSTWVERFDRRGTEPFELFTSELGQNSWNRKKTTKNHFIEVACDPKCTKGPEKGEQTALRPRGGLRSRTEFFQNSGIFTRKLKKQKISTFFKLSAKFRQNFIKIRAKISEKNSKITNFCNFFRIFWQILQKRF